jgi:hypothetical protein
MPGIGIRTAARILLEVGDGSHFRTPGHLAAYLRARFRVTAAMRAQTREQAATFVDGRRTTTNWSTSDRRDRRRAR